MAKIIDVIGYGPVEFPDGMSQEDMMVALKKLPPLPSAPAQQTQAATPEALPLTPQQRERIAAAETADLSKPALAAPKQRAVALQERAVKVRAEEAAKYSYDDLHKNPELLNKLTAYGSVRLGKTGLPQKDESAKDYVDRVVSHIRSVTEDPNPIRVTSEQEWINNSKPEDVVKAGEAYDILENTASFLDPRGQAPLSALKDYAGLMLSNPLTYASVGVGKVAVNIVGKEAAKFGIKKALTSKIGATAAASPLLFEGASGTTTNVYKQKRELAVADATVQEMEKILPSLSEEDQNKLLPKIEAERAKVDKGISVSEALTAGAIQAPFGMLETAPLLFAATKGTKFLKGDKLTLKDLTDARKQQLATSKKPATLTGDEAADNVSVTTTNIYDGGDLLDMQGSPTSIAQMQVKNSIDKQADLIAASIWKQIPEYAPKAGEKTFEAVQRTLDSFDNLPDNVIRQSMTDAGTDLPNFMARLSAAGLDEEALKKFSSMYGVSTSDAARTLQSKSVISRMLNKMREVDPEASKAVDALFGKKDPVSGPMMTFKGWIDKADRNMITAMTTNMSTVMRNAFGVGTNLTYGAAEEGLESLIFNTGRKIAGKMRGSPVAGDIGKGFNGVIDDTVSGYFYLGQGDLSREITEEALKNNPMLMSKMLATAEDMKNSDLIAPIRILNTPAVIMDNYVRRAIFSASIDNNLRKTGLNLVDLIAQDKNIPIDVLRQGVDDALTFTFSKTPTEGLGLAFVKGVEAVRPISTTVFPFARFLVNATQWTAKHYNPWYAGKGAAEAIEGVRLLKNGDEAGSKMLLQGSEKIAQQATGMATLLAAYAYRRDNQDTPWNVAKSDDGTKVDLKYLFPVNVPFALADFYYKIANGNPEDFKAMDLVEALTGFKSVGSTSESLERIKEVAASMFATGEKETDQSALNKVSRSSGDLVGAWLGRATVPLNQISDIISAFDSNEALPRDIYSTKPEEDRTFLTAVGKNIQKGIPILKQALPEYQPATRTQAPFRDTGPLKQMTGLALVPPKNAIEAEIEARNIPFNAIFATTGDKTVDSEARKYIANNIDKYISPIINMDLYKNATDAGKSLDLKTALSELQTDAKKIAIDESIAKFYEMGKVPPIEQKQFEAVPPKLRRVTLDFYKQQYGVSLESDPDFKKYGKALEISKALKPNAIAVQKPTEKATGGVVGYQVGGLAVKQLGKEVGSSAVMKSSMSLLKEMQDAAAKMVVKEAPTEILPTPVVKEAAAKIPLVKSKPTPTLSEPKPIDAEMEKLVSDAEASFTPPPKVEPEVVPEIKTELPMEAAVPLSPYKKGLAEGDLNKDKYGFSRDSDIITDFEVRQNTLTALKQTRTDAFDKLIEMPNVAGKIEDDVIAVAQGEYRAAKGKEVDINDPKAVEDFVSFSMPLQEKLNKLREKYKDRPPKVLYHGTEYNAEERATKGFFDPQTLPAEQARQQELNVGATSFTSDARFNYANTSFGGTNPENIVQTSIPYADYEFRRINMARDKYTKSSTGGDMNTIARSITGSPTVARPLGLPRSIGMRESEDAFTESEKLAISRNMYETEKKTPLFKQQEDIFNTTMDRLQELRNNFLSPNSLKPIKEGGLGSEEVQALKAYRLIRGLIRNEFRETGGKAASEAGFKAIVTSNQSTASRLNSKIARSNLVRSFDLTKFIPDVISTLEKVGSKDKAEALTVLQQQFKTLQKNDIGSATTNTEMTSAVKEETKAVNAIRDLVGGDYRDKENKKRIGLAKGGLASRR
jgi:antitoxin component HigA of HigAB toxin-antitoxin module